MPAAISVDFSGVTLPFTVPDMLTTATSFMGIYSTWILLGLGVLFSGVIIGTIFSIMSRAKKSGGGGAKA